MSRGRNRERGAWWLSRGGGRVRGKESQETGLSTEPSAGLTPRTELKSRVQILTH